MDIVVYLLIVSVVTGSIFSLAVFVGYRAGYKAGIDAWHQDFTKRVNFSDERGKPFMPYRD